MQDEPCYIAYHCPVRWSDGIHVFVCDKYPKVASVAILSHVPMSEGKRCRFMPLYHTRKMGTLFGGCAGEWRSHSQPHVPVLSRVSAAIFLRAGDTSAV